MRPVKVFAPGRVNLIGDHTDYTGGWVLPLAIHLGTTIEGRRGGREVVLESADAAGECRVPLNVVDPSAVEPPWARYVAGVVAELRPREGFAGSVSSTLPLGAGLSSSASLEVAVALALGAELTPRQLALLCQQAEHRGPLVPCGIMDQLVVSTPTNGEALLIDCWTFNCTAVSLGDIALYAVHCGQPRRLADAEYARRRADCEAAERVIGPLRDVSRADLTRIGDERLRRRARHVVSENERVLAFAAALRDADHGSAGLLMNDSHRSLRDDFEVSTPALDALVERLQATPGVYGARLTGAGFGGCVVVLADPAAPAEAIGGWRLLPGRLQRQM